MIHTLLINKSLIINQVKLININKYQINQNKIDT